MMAFLAAFITAMPVSAMENSDVDEIAITANYEVEDPVEPVDPVDPAYVTGSGTIYGHSWATVAKRTNGINKWIRLTVTTAVDCDVDIRMKDKNGNVVWSENKAFRADDDHWRTFWCGSNICTVEARLSTGNPFVNINIVTAPYLTEYGVPAP